MKSKIAWLKRHAARRWDEISMVFFPLFISIGLIVIITRFWLWVTQF